VIPLFMRAAIDGTPATVFGDGEQTRDFTYVDNVVEANLLAATRAAERCSGHPVNVGAGERTSLLQLIALIREVSGRPLTVQHRPARGGDVRDSLASLERIASLLGYAPSVRLEDGLRRTWDWFRRSNGGTTTARAMTGAGTHGA
jgi:nucleoside-diphosphate-sugar epimerase